MKEKIKTFLSICLLVVALPYIITLLFQGNNTVLKNSPFSFFTEMLESESDKETTVEIELDSKEMEMEEYLIGVVANEIPVIYEPEMIKAQIVIARTNLYNMIEKGETMPQALDSKQMLKLWGQDGFTDNYQTLKESVDATKGETIYYNGTYIDAAFHAVSAGKTRTATEIMEADGADYLAGVDSHFDIPAEDFLKVKFYSKEEFVEKILNKWNQCGMTIENIMDTILITNRDSAEYVLELKLGEEMVTGEDFRNEMNLNSACFYIAEVEEQIRVVTKGLGHGLGLSQYGGNEMAKSGKTYKEILNYYYKDVEIKQ